MIAPYKQFSEKMFRYCIDELQHKAKLCEKTSLVTVFDGDVVKSDTAVSETLRQNLIEAVKPLEDIPEVSSRSSFTNLLKSYLSSKIVTPGADLFI